MIAFETPIPILWIAIGFILAIAILAWLSFGLRSLLRPRYLWSLAGLRGFACIAIVLLLLNPYRISKEPDADGFRVAVLLDASGSMDTRDIENGSRSRFDILSDWLEKTEHSPIHRLREKGYSLDISLFAEENLPFSGGDLRLLPGGTAIGGALRNETSQPGRQADLGGVLLISDGRSNSDPSAIEVSRQFRALGIPVSTIGIGSRTPPGEIKTTFTKPRFQGERGEPMDLTVSVSNTRQTEESVDLELHNEEGIVDRQTVTIPANSEKTVAFNVIPFQAGGQAFRVVAKTAGAPDEIDVAAVEVNEPDHFRILYLSGKPTAEYRFLQQSAHASEQIAVEAIIRTGPESFFHRLTEEQERLAPNDAFPHEADFFNAFDAIIADSSLWSEIGEGAEALQNFVAHRGGGLLLTGDLSELPEELKVLSPVTAFKIERPFVRRNLSITPAPIFSELTGGMLFGTPPVFLPIELPSFIATEWKRGARTIVQMTEGNEVQPLMMAHAYGAGRVGWIGTDATWRWRMSSATGLEQHSLFWNNVMVWLASTGKPRLSVPLQGKRVALAEEIVAGIEVMGSDFRPAREAEVEANVLLPGGETRQLHLQPSFRQPGRFETDFHPDEAGEYRIRYRISFPEGEELTYESFFIASHHDRERLETAYNEELLRDIARLTGGEFRHYSDAQPLRDIPLKEGIPTRESRRYLAGNPLFLLLLALPLFGEWYLRRKVGLK